MTAAFSILTHSARYKWHVVFMLWLIAFFNYADRAALNAVLPLLKGEMALSDTELGLLASAFAWVYGLGAPFAGYIVDRVPRKAAILAGLHIWSVVCMATALSQKFWHLFVFRAAEGLGETWYFPASMSYLSDYHGKHTRSRALAIHQTSAYAGTTLGGLFAGLIGQYYGWRWSFIVFGGMGILLGFALHRFLKEPQRGAADRVDLENDAPQALPSVPVGLALRKIVTTPTAVLLIFAYLCTNFLSIILFAWTPSYLYRTFDMNLAASAFNAFFFVQAASFVGAPLGGYLADKLRLRLAGGRLLIQALGALAATPFVLVTGMATDLYLVLAALAAWGFFKGIYDSNIFASMFDVIAPEIRGITVGIMQLVGWVGGGFAPAIVGYIADSSSLGFAIASGAIVYIFAAVLLGLGAAFTARGDVARVSPV